jgi:hypothetical protein
MFFYLPFNQVAPSSEYFTAGSVIVVSSSLLSSGITSITLHDLLED